MRVLLTNDDGIFAPGLAALVEAFSQAGHAVYVCAPDRERSAASHSVTLARPLRAEPMELPGAARAWAVDGTPADCASLGLYLTRGEGVELVVSGINRGMNQGGACVYSGTVAAALEASMCGCQGLAVSLSTWDVRGEDNNDYAPAARIALRVAGWLGEHPLPRGAMLNLNVPPLPFGQIRGIRPATLAPVFLQEALYAPVKGEDGVRYQFQNGDGLPLDDPEYDVSKTAQGYATLTKLTWDMRLDAGDRELGEIEL